MRGVWFGLVMLVAACGGRSPVMPQVTAVLDDTFALRPGQEVSFGSEPLRLTFDAVTEDSRCPTDVTCVWAGNAGVRLRATVPGDLKVVVLNTTLEPHAASAFGYDIRLERLEPAPVSDRDIPRAEYLVYLTVSRD